MHEMIEHGFRELRGPCDLTFDSGRNCEAVVHLFELYRPKMQFWFGRLNLDAEVIDSGNAFEIPADLTGGPGSYFELFLSDGRRGVARPIRSTIGSGTMDYFERGVILDFFGLGGLARQNE